MIQRLKKVTDGLYRGSAPSSKDVLWLKEKLDINKIVSLDEISGNKIDRICKILHIQHIMLPIDASRRSLLNFFSHDLKKLLLNNGPTYLHCQQGKDRTGLVIALFKCKYMGIDPESAIKEAKELGFGINVNPKITNLYEKLIRSCNLSFKDRNNADIVSNEREYKGDNRDSFLDEGHQGSFAPYLDKTKQYPMDAVYNYIDEQSPTRENYHSNKLIQIHQIENVIPQVGVFNNDAGGRGFGPTENYSGFFYD